MLGAFVAVGTVFGLLAALAAYLIAFGEYGRHKSMGAKARRESLLVSGLAFAFFLGAAIAIGLLLGFRP